MPILTLLTDFGLEDYYVAAVKGTVLRLAPGTQVVDVSHLVPAGDVEAGSYLLAAAFPSFPPGTVHLAVVDPGVGSSRRILIASVPSGTPEGPPSWLVAPDNGLLTPLLAAAGPVRSVERSDVFLQGPGQTFHGRDRFAPVAAWLLRGEPAEELGPEISDPQRLAVEPPRRAEGLVEGHVVHIDRYGNLVTNVPAGWIPAAPFRVEVGFHATRHRVSHYAEIPPGEAAILPGSLGTVEISVNGEDLACRWKVRRGDPVRIVW
jgi:S-adenosyl-L-methionine hydrolase (adenosine-forming)